VGSLTVGRRADVIAVESARPHVAPNLDPWSAVAYGLASADVRHTVVEGRVLMRDRVLTTIDEPAVLDRMARLRRARSEAFEETL
jgi:5-methylthioadenosine/S-adenosylhomocysteine deaminase